MQDVILRVLLAFFAAAVTLAVLVFILYRFRDGLRDDVAPGSTGVFGLPLSCQKGSHDWRYIGMPPLARQCRILPCGKLEYLREEQMPEGFREYMEQMTGSDRYRYRDISGDTFINTKTNKVFCSHGISLDEGCACCTNELIGDGEN